MPRKSSGQRPKRGQSPAQAALRAERLRQGRCVQCGAPAAVRVILDEDGEEVEREILTRCARHR